MCIKEMINTYNVLVGKPEIDHKKDLGRKILPLILGK